MAKLAARFVLSVFMPCQAMSARHARLSVIAVQNPLLLKGYMHAPPAPTLVGAGRGPGRGCLDASDCGMAMMQGWQSAQHYHRLLGDRKGIHRFGDFTAPLDEALVHVVLVSKNPCQLPNSAMLPLLLNTGIRYPLRLGRPIWLDSWCNACNKLSFSLQALYQALCKD